MSVNRSRPHIFVIPEDDADRQIADGFVLHARVAARQVQVVAPAGGWARVRDVFVEEYLPRMQRNRDAHVVMLIDFDGNPDSRRAQFDAVIPIELQSRVFVVGPRETPELLRQSLGRGYEEIGKSLADDCDRDTTETWNHEQLRHNESDRLRLRESVRDFLFAQVS